MKRRKLASMVFAAAVLAWAASAGAVDGTIEINQAKVLAGSGFPYVISTANTSYRLTSSLTVSSTTADAIDVTASHVTIDLNGFSIVGAGGSTNTSDGINGSTAGALTVENGTVTSFQIDIYTGNYGIVRNVHATGGHVGIKAGTGNVISGNTADANGTAGIWCVGSGCAIYGNTVVNNTSSGIFAADNTTGYGANVVYNNGTDVSGPTSMGNNVVGGVLK
jgi:parallel beta-helix repeat protein